MGSLAGRVAVVTGASRGVGKGCALELGAAGATVYVTGRTFREGKQDEGHEGKEDKGHEGKQDKGKERGKASLPGSVSGTAEEVDRIGGRGIAVRCDHRDDGQVEALFERIRDEAGQLDVLVNNAFSIPRELTSGRPFWEVPISNWDDMIDVGTRSAYVASRFAAQLMVPRRKGLIVNISSSGAAEYAWHVAYGVGKAALDRLTHDTAHELRKHGVAVVSLWPGLVMTERTKRVGELMPELDVSGAESQRFTGRAVAALASDARILERSGRAIASRQLADEYGFTDIDGSLPRGPLHERPEGVPGSQPDLP